MTLNKPNPRLAILRAQLAAERLDILEQRAEYIISMEHPRCRPAPKPDANALPLPPSYWEDLEFWTKTLAPAKPAAPQPEPTQDVWRSEAPSVAGLYVASAFRNANKVRWFDGNRWYIDVNADGTENARAKGVATVDFACGIEWLRLIEADAPAAKDAP